MIIYDCEILRCIPNGAYFSGYEYCEGWDDFYNMGIACIGYSIDFKEAQCFEWADLDRRVEFLEAIDNEFEVIGFNSVKFDDKLLDANGFQVSTTYDLLEEIRIAAYGSSRWEDQPEGYSYALGKLGEANGYHKTGSGSLAPQWWQEGRKDEVMAYCKNDVMITGSLLQLGIEGKLVDPNNGKLLKLPPAQ